MKLRNLIYISSLMIMLFALSGCTEQLKPSQSINTDAPEMTFSVPEETPEATTALTTCTTATEPEFILPDVVTADEYTKQAIDILESGKEFDYVHSVSYPKINSDAPGAVALNQKISEVFGEIIGKLKNNTEQNELYNVSYTYSAKDNIIFIGIDCSVSWQYSEGYNSKALYYYDAENDVELSPEEYAEHFDIDPDSIINRAKWSIEVFNIGAKELIYSETPYGVSVDAVESNKLYYVGCEIVSSEMFGDHEISVLGIEMTDSGIKAYMEYTPSYSGGVFTCELDSNLLPISPAYAINIIPESSDRAGIIEFADGNPVSATAPVGIDKIEILGRGIAIEYSGDAPKVTLNGTELFGYAHYEKENTYLYYFDYVNAKELKTITITY